MRSLKPFSVSLIVACFITLAGILFSTAHVASAQDDTSPPGDMAYPPFTIQQLTPSNPGPFYIQPSDPAGEPPIPPHERALLSDDALAAVAGNNHFAFNIFDQLAANAGNNNLLVSPFSISTALAMTYAGARGETAQQMAGVLGFSLPNDRLHPAFGQLIGDLTTPRDGYQLNIANRLFGQQGLNFNPQFLNTTATDYGAPLQQLDFKTNPDGSRQTINQWVADQTNNRIQNLLPFGSVDPSTRLVLTNAIYFNGQWKNKFDTQNTFNQTFYQQTGSQSSVSMMHQQNSFQYAQMPGFQVLQMPYAGDDLSMVMLLPNDRNGLTNLEHSLTDTVWNSTIASLHNTTVVVTMPKFTFDSSFKLADVLKQMGMTDAFTNADFSGMTSDAPVAINDVIHKAFINVGEEGTEAAAATAVTITTTSAAYDMPSEPQIFTADHPFLFALEDNHSGSILFLGQVTDPGSLAAVPEPLSITLLATGFTLLLVRRKRDAHLRAERSIK
jgi:serpin B